MVRNDHSDGVGLVEHASGQRSRNARTVFRWRPPLYRLATAWARVLPDFIIVGAQKCGTSSLYHYLVQHPCIVSAARKEVHFFDLAFGQGLAWYRAHFPMAAGLRYVRYKFHRSWITGESSPYYLFHPLAPKRMAQLVPHAKLVVLLRNPVDRAYSHYHHELRKGRETLSFEEAIDRESERLHGGTERLAQGEIDYSVAHHRHAYLARGIYVDQLLRLEQWFPRKQILVLQSEEFFRQPRIVLQRVTQFLALPDWAPDNFHNRNPGSYSSMEPTTRQRLTAYFHPHNKRLYEYLGTDLGWSTEEHRRQPSG